MTRRDCNHAETGRTGSDRFRGKSVLFCRTCGHESPIAGDWAVSFDRSDGGDRLVYSCPRCGTTLTVRSRRSAPTIGLHR